MHHESDAPDDLDPLWKRAEEAAAKDDFAGLLFIWRALVEKGVWQLCARVGELYERGAPGIKSDPEQALSWYRKAIYQGDDPIAHLGMGRAYFNGIGCSRDFAAALKHFKKAYASGEPEGALFLGLMHYRGTGVERDKAQAKKYFEEAAAAEYPAAYAYLARIAWGSWNPIRALSLWRQGINIGSRLVEQDVNDPKLVGLNLKR